MKKDKIQKIAREVIRFEIEALKDLKKKLIHLLKKLSN